MRVHDRVKETTSSTGTGALTLLGPVAGYVSFANGVEVNNVCHYLIKARDTDDWEVGQGSLTGSTTLTRDSVESSSNSNTLVNFSSGLKDVMVVASAKYLNDVELLGYLGMFL